MRFLLQLPFIRYLYERHLLLPTVAAAAMLSVLLHGAFSHEREAEASAGNILALPMPPSLPDLRPNLEKTPLTYQSDYYLQLGEQAKNKLVLVGQQKLPGLVVSPGVILTSIRAADESTRLRLQQRALRAYESEQSPVQDTEPASKPEDAADLLVIEVSPLDPEASPQRIPLIAADPELGVALLEMEQPYIAAPFAPVDPAVLTPGSPVLAVTLLPDERLEITPGYLTSPGVGESSEDSDPLHVSIAFPEPPAMAAIVDLDGRLVAAAVESSGGGTRLLSSNQVLRIVDRLREGIPCRAIEVSDLTEAARDVLNLSSGVLVEMVQREAFLPEPSIRPGDFLLQWDGQTISASEQFYSLYDSNPAALIRFQVLRDQKRVAGVTVIPGPDCRAAQLPLQVLPTIGLTVRWIAGPGPERPAASPAGWKVLSVTPESPASSVGVEPGDLVFAVDGVRLDETRGEQQLLLVEKNRRPFVLTLRRGDRMKLVTVAREPQ